MSEESLAQQPIATWNTARGVWETNQANLFCEHWELYSVTWPTSGMTLNGQAYELPMRVRLTTDSGYSSLPTPTVSDQYTANLSSTQQSEGSLHSVTLAQIVTGRPDLMPTPTTRDHKDGTQPHERGGQVQTDTIARAVFNSGEVLKSSWGKFEPAIRRWEQTLGRPAPAPTQADGKDGAHRLSSRFTEWMMGLPDGWITDCGLSRNDELKACGNGVVPQQAELALRILLEGVEIK